jgi:hypothetical protein
VLQKKIFCAVKTPAFNCINSHLCDYFVTASSFIPNLTLVEEANTVLTLRIKRNVTSGYKSSRYNVMGFTPFNGTIKGKQSFKLRQYGSESKLKGPVGKLDLAMGEHKTKIARISDGAWQSEIIIMRIIIKIIIKI